MQNIVDDVTLHLTAAGLAQTDTVVLLRLDSGALERKVYTGYVLPDSLRDPAVGPDQFRRDLKTHLFV